MEASHEDRLDLDDLDIPRAVLLAWRVAPTTTKGPRPRWTLDQLLDTAVRLGDRDGIEAISMSGLAKALGSGITSLYRYVESREVLVVLAADRALGSPPTAQDGTWRERLQAWVLDLRRTYQDHPWLTALPIGSEPLLPSYLRRLEAGLACLAEPGMRGTRAITVLTLLWTYTRGDVEQGSHLAATAQRQGFSAGDMNRFLAARLRAVGRSDEFPRLLDLLDADDHQPATESVIANDEAEFLDAVDVILDGVESSEANRRPAAAADPGRAS